MDKAASLTAAERGRYIKYQGREFCVTETTTNRESGTYTERQWTLESGSEELYLIKTEEKKASGLEVLWVLTRQTSLGGVTYEISPGEWIKFRESSMPDTAPRVVRCMAGDYNYEGSTSVRAEDDEGDMVPKITWDYYLPGRRKNLAIEIWKEPDQDYPEAYLGDIVRPEDFEVLDKKARAGTYGKGSLPGFEGVKAGLTGFGMFGFIAIANGFPMDYYFALGVPLALVIVMCLMRVPVWLGISSACVWAFVLALGEFGGFKLSFWYIAVSCAALSALLPRLMRLFFSGEEISEHWRVAAFGALPALWVYSFIEYAVFAPGPHAAYQFFAACLLPLAAAGAAALLNRALEGSDGRP
ncbi:MAG TPA: hypothetical protein DCZ92_13350 [Elusimicrobia bacterium]|nr:MAG: hypothetical protein A2016_08365 [Elusimicrobia bacterium GWF2_62_30]HBA61768.1 hypothetical protein [Elusimicrobiota bacterium]